MRFFSVPRTVVCADKLLLNIVDTYFSPNCTGRERACPTDCRPPNIHSKEICMNRLSVVAVSSTRPVVAMNVS